MKHFTEAQWADFPRNLIAGKEKADMQLHVQGGCQKCDETMQIWQSVLAIAEKESGITPPSDIVRVVKSQMAAVAVKAGRGVPGPVRFGFTAHKLRNPRLGIRLGNFSTRRMTTTSTSRLEPRPPPQADRACLVGQILHPERYGPRGRRHVSVRIQKGKPSGCGGPPPIASARVSTRI